MRTLKCLQGLRRVPPRFCEAGGGQRPVRMYIHTHTEYTCTRIPIYTHVGHTHTTTTDAKCRMLSDI